MTARLNMGFAWSPFHFLDEVLYVSEAVGNGELEEHDPILLKGDLLAQHNMLMSTLPNRLIFFEHPDPRGCHNIKKV